ncbi:MAG: phosphoribosylformylglycinamidine synthase I [Planctomycetota bacterium]
MATPRALVIRTAGTNCDRETIYALEQAGFAAERIHLLRIMDLPALLKNFQFLVIPGGFSYGDDVAAGKIFANQMLYRLAEPLNEFLADGKLVIGICNGFQVAIKSGLLPWASVQPHETNTQTTLAWNDSGRFEDRWVHLKVATDRTPFLPAGEVIALPIAHGEGKFVTDGDRTLGKLRHGGQIALTYCDEAGEPGPYPINPNGSMAGIAGICDPTGRVLGLMPHPERFVDVTHHPQWTRREIRRADGMLFFQGAYDYLAK